MGEGACQTLGGWERLEARGTWRVEGEVKLRGQKGGSPAPSPTTGTLPLGVLA